MKDLVKNTIISIGISMMIFCLVGIVFDINGGGSFDLENYQFTKMVLGCIGVGLGFGIPSVIYQNDHFPMPIKVIIHLGIGSLVYSLIAYCVGWIGQSTSMSYELMILAFQLSVALVIWLLFMIHYRNEAKKINERIQNLKS